jgi:hypothetical protein
MIRVNRNTETALGVLLESRPVLFSPAKMGSWHSLSHHLRITYIATASLQQTALALLKKGKTLWPDRSIHPIFRLLPSTPTCSQEHTATSVADLDSLLI